MALIFAILLTVLMGCVLVTDVTRYRIPNLLVLILLVLWPLCYLLVPGTYGWLGSIGVAMIIFGAGMALFAAGKVGGGDVKLLAVLALYAGREQVVPLVFYMALLGGVMAFALLLLRPSIPYAYSFLGITRPVPRVLKPAEPVPYGVAIAIGFLILLWMGELPSLPLELG